MPDELRPVRLRRRLLEVAAVVVVVAIVVITGPGLGEVRDHLEDASFGWIGIGVVLELLSVLCYIVIFRAVFCPRMSRKLSVQIALAEQGANSVLSVSGTGGLALGAWALRRGGMNAEEIGRKSVAFFFLTSFANVAAVIVFAALYALGLLARDRNSIITYAFGLAALAATAVVLALPALLGRPAKRSPAAAAAEGRLARLMQFARISLVDGVRDGVMLLRRRSPGVLIGAFGTTAFDLAVLGVCFHAFGASPSIGTLALGYLIGQLGGNLPLPGGIGGLDGGLIGTFVLYHQPLAATTAAVLIYHAISLWVPGLLGSLAFARLHRALERERQPAAMCVSLAEPIEESRPVHAGRASVD